MAICYQQWHFSPCLLFVDTPAVYKMDVTEALAAPASVACELRIFRENTLRAQETMWKTMMERMSDEEWLDGWKRVSSVIFAEVRHMLRMTIQTWLWTQPLAVVQKHYPFIRAAEWVPASGDSEGELVVHLLGQGGAIETIEMKTLREHAGLLPHQMRFEGAQDRKRRRTSMQA